jgi:hypothetical protein
VRVLRPVLVAQLQVDLKEGEFDLFGTHSLNFVSGIVHIDDLECVLHLDGDRHEIQNRINVAFNTASGHVE